MKSSTKSKVATVRQRIEGRRRAPDVEETSEFTLIDANEVTIPAAPQLDQVDETTQNTTTNTKKRKSKVAVEYDPGPDPFAVPDGLGRPDRRCWVDRIARDLRAPQ